MILGNEEKFLFSLDFPVPMQKRKARKRFLSTSGEFSLPAVH